MQIVLLDESRFDSYAINHPNYNFYQSSNYGKLMTKNGYNAYYLGLVTDTDEIKAASLVIVKNDKNDRRKMGYAPRGFLIDWNDEELVKEFTVKIKDFLSKRGFTYLKIDPMMIYKEHNRDGSEILSGINNINFVKKLQSLGYIHMGYNKGLEASKPRWNAITELTPNIISLYNSISKEAKDKISKSLKFGNKVYKGTKEDIELFYSTLNNKNTPIDLYMDFYEFFNKINGFEIYFTKLEPVEFVNKSKTMYEKEEMKNSELNRLIQDINNPNKNEIINEKLKSDSLVSEYKKKMIDAINFFQKYPNGIIIASVAIIKYGKKVTFFTSGINDEFKEYYPEYLLKWQLIDQFAKQGYEMIDFNGMNGNFNNDYNSIIKRELSNKIVEYVGEFDLVINKKSYYTGGKITSILNWLDTPI